MNELERIQELYRGYLAEAEEVLRTKKVTDGLWGFGKHPADHPCHGKFLEDLEAALGERYGADYPRRTRLPAQDQVFAALKW